MSEHEDSMLERIYIDNYKRLVNFELPLQALSLLLGRNGMGKTAVLDVAFGVRRLLSGAARVTDADAFPTRTLTRWQDRNLQSFEMDVALDAESFRYRLEVEHERATRQGRVRREELTSNGRPLFGCDLGKVAALSGRSFGGAAVFRGLVGISAGSSCGGPRQPAPHAVPRLRESAGRMRPAAGRLAERVRE